MKRFVAILAVSLAGALPAVSQSLEDLNIQIHGYATQGFLYTTQNNIFTTASSNGSPAWTEAVVNVSSQPIPKLRVAAQARYFLLGNYGNAITLDWASADYKANDEFGVRFGKVKTPSGLFNEIQDIDPSYIWSLLPQSVYPIGSRNSNLSHYGGVVYGTLKFDKKAGKLEYRGWAGEREIGADDGYWLNLREEGLGLPNGLGGVVTGGALKWRTPLPGLMIGASDIKNNRWEGPMTDFIPGNIFKGTGDVTMMGTFTLNPLNVPQYFAQFEHDKLMVAAEYSRLDGQGPIQFPGLPASQFKFDDREKYAMASYKVSNKLNAGAYCSQIFDHTIALGPPRYSKDWAVSGRYDFGQFLYAKAEQHFIDGTKQDYDADLNPNGLNPTTRLTILKIGVNF
jgi:hypothetical protein